MSHCHHGPKLTLKTVVKRMRALPNAGGHTLFFKAEQFGKSGAFFRVQDMPEEFEGEEAEFEYERSGGRIFLKRLVRVTKR
jgi:hypothetical protein